MSNPSGGTSLVIQPQLWHIGGVSGGQPPPACLWAFSALIGSPPKGNALPIVLDLSLIGGVRVTKLAEFEMLAVDITWC